MEYNLPINYRIKKNKRIVIWVNIILAVITIPLTIFWMQARGPENVVYWIFFTAGVLIFSLIIYHLSIISMAMTELAESNKPQKEDKDNKKKLIFLKTN